MKGAAAALLLALLGAAFHYFPGPGPAKPPARSAEEDFIRVPAPGAVPPELAAAGARLGTESLAARIRFLAAPAREGRGLGTKGLEAAAGYIAGELEAAGIRPLGPSYFQRVPLREVRPAGGNIVLRAGPAVFAFAAGRDAVLPRLELGTFSAPLVFAGYGISEPSLGRDDLRGLDLRGKIAVFIGGVPPGPGWEKPELLEKYASGRPADRYDARLELLQELGARAAIALEPGLDRAIAAGKEPPEPYFLPPAGAPRAEETPLARVNAAPELLALCAAAGPEGRAELAVRGEVRDIVSFNVLGRLEGTAGSRQAVMLGAHMDHLGRPGGRLHPGADDNASGTAALLEIARAVAAGPRRPRRTLLFAFWTGEEEGKFGSGAYVRRPLWPLPDTSAYLNLDMIGHPWTRKELKELVLGAGLRDPGAFLDGLSPEYFAEAGVSAGRPGLGPLLAAAARGAGMSLHLDRTDGRSGGSDYREFARRGVPFVRFFGTYFPGYHSPADTADRLDAGQVRRMARLALNAAWLLADR